MNTVWFAYVGWAKPDEDRPAALSLTDLILEPLDSYESALWSLRRQAAEFWGENVGSVGGVYEAPNFALMDEAQIRGAFTMWRDVEIFDHDETPILVEIKEVSIINRNATGWRTLDLMAREAALGGALPTLHRFQHGLASNNEVVRCVVTYDGKDFFGPWCGDEASALAAANKLTPSRE